LRSRPASSRPIPDEPQRIETIAQLPPFGGPSVGGDVRAPWSALFLPITNPQVSTIRA
jgi:hypothetical protein